jgi:hypothetical protein
LQKTIQQSDAYAFCSVSFSEEAPRVKFIPGSAEQRGTNFVLALSGERPFCRPLKHGGAYFLLTAEVDGKRKDAIFLGLQVRCAVYH